MLRFFCVLGLVLSALCTTVAQSEKQERQETIRTTERILCRVYYLPSTAETYSPVDSEGIKSAGSVIDVTDPVVFAQMIGSIGKNGTVAKFDDRVVRLRVSTSKPRATILVDQDGVVRRDGKEFMVRPIDLLRLNELMNRITKQPQ